MNQQHQPIIITARRANNVNKRSKRTHKQTNRQKQTNNKQTQHSDIKLPKNILRHKKDFLFQKQNNFTLKSCSIVGAGVHYYTTTTGTTTLTTIAAATTSITNRVGNATRTLNQRTHNHSHSQTRQTHKHTPGPFKTNKEISLSNLISSELSVFVKPRQLPTVHGNSVLFLKPTRFVVDWCNECVLTLC